MTCLFSAGTEGRPSAPRLFAGWSLVVALLLASAASAAHVVQQKATRDDPAFQRHAVVRSDGAVIAYYLRPGTGPTLVLVPETHGDRTQFQEQGFLRTLDPSFGVLIVECRGQGRSWPPPTPAYATIERYASDVLAVVAQAALPAWYIGGHSLGGMIALEVAGRRPAGLRGVIALEGWVHARVQREAFPAAAPVDEAQKAEARRQREARYQSQRWTSEEVAALGQIWTKWQGGEAIVRALRTPLLSVWGDRGRKPLPNEALLLPTQPHVEVRWIAGSDHYVTDPPHDVPVAAAINDFVRKVETRFATVAPEHSDVFHEPGRFGGWPANNGLWSWGDEVLVGITAGWHKKQDSARHQIDRTRPPEPAFARSVDGGRTWQFERPAGILTAEASVALLAPLTEAIDFQRPGFALTLRYHGGVSYYYFSYDRGRTWRGPHRLPEGGLRGLQARTDYLVHDARELTAFVTALKSDGKEGRPVALRTSDGGLTWARVGMIGEEPAGFSIMPSTLALAPAAWLTAVRVNDPAGNWIDAWSSADRGRTWHAAGRPVPDTGGRGGNPPSLIRLKDGRLCLTYGYRSPPFGIRARLSRDQGMTWEPEIVLRADAVAHDLGYPRSFQRADGKVVTVYYYNLGTHTERFIASTTWTPAEVCP
ncbi:alpha/beta fold hydrolase [Horticoccus sp. 23ND18S-11]|uniref:alpha/beta fold hydrolase n=1 Tax=Horticoccus sp. 23ND18S-11 TaxID=3391832 RepID=UPI0039C9C5B8